MRNTDVHPHQGGVGWGTPNFTPTLLKPTVRPCKFASYAGRNFQPNYVDVYYAIMVCYIQPVYYNFVDRGPLIPVNLFIWVVSCVNLSTLTAVDVRLMVQYEVICIDSLSYEPICHHHLRSTTLG